MCIQASSDVSRFSDSMGLNHIEIISNLCSNLIMPYHFCRHNRTWTLYVIYIKHVIDFERINCSSETYRTWTFNLCKTSWGFSVFGWGILISYDNSVVSLSLRPGAHERLCVCDAVAARWSLDEPLCLW